MNWLFRRLNDKRVERLQQLLDNNRAALEAWKVLAECDLNEIARLKAVIRDYEESNLALLTQLRWHETHHERAPANRKGKGLAGRPMQTHDVTSLRRTPPRRST